MGKKEMYERGSVGQRVKKASGKRDPGKGPVRKSDCKKEGP